MKKTRKCIGFGIYEGKCVNIVNKKINLYWCKRCDKLRRHHISKQLNMISKKMEKEK